MRRSDQRRDAVFACYQQEVTDRPLSALLVDARPFTVELAEGVDRHRAELDGAIDRFATGWDLSRIAPLEKNIMRVALFEMNFRDDVPAEVAIDEAVELAKKYSGSEAPGFVNGILGAASRSLEESGSLTPEDQPPAVDALAADTLAAEAVTADPAGVDPAETAKADIG
jgi:N utilization substance protein B